MTETKPPQECSRADQNQAKNKNLYIMFFGGGVTIYIYLLPPMSLFVILGIALSSYLGDVIFE